ncbi:MAG TPA: AAA family ATPase, partial [Aggregatilineales bacterium]|nr:AAA family ATPase [Aggregatilineales bacterium]
GGSGNLKDTFYIRLADLLRQRIYCFKAERLNLAYAEIAATDILKTNAENLPQVLHQLQTTNPELFKKFNGFVSTIFPQIKQVTAPYTNQNVVRIFIFDNDTLTRDDLSIDLADSGTGIGQVLAMLYVVLTADQPQVIIIDEPQSFLHPGAVRILFEILRQRFSQHQYIVTTHSPTAIASAAPQSLVLVRKVGAESRVEVVDAAEAESLRSCLLELGARPSDVFGYDQILWVEGATEERCFPLIVERILRQPMLGTAIIGVAETSLFDKKNSNVLVRIYERLSRGRGLIPPSIGIILDREARSDELIAKLEANGLSFLARSMYENYLLNSSAIAATLGSIKELEGLAISPEKVNEWLEEHKWEKDFIKLNPNTERHESDWLKNVHGKKVLDALFNELSGNRLRYEGNEVEYGLSLTTWLIEISPDELQEVTDLILSKLNILNDVG